MVPDLNKQMMKVTITAVKFHEDRIHLTVSQCMTHRRFEYTLNVNMMFHKLLSRFGKITCAQILSYQIDTGKKKKATFLTSLDSVV